MSKSHLILSRYYRDSTPHSSEYASIQCIRMYSSGQLDSAEYSQAIVESGYPQIIRITDTLLLSRNPQPHYDGHQPNPSMSSNYLTNSFQRIIANFRVRKFLSTFLVPPVRFRQRSQHKCGYDANK